MDYNKIVKEIREEVKPFEGEGEIATYIPELAKIDPDQFGMYIKCIGGEDFQAGQSFTKFSIQSISKVFAVTMAYSMLGEEIWERVGVEPSGNPFNSIMQLEYEDGIPRNPMINSGAFVISDILYSHLNNPKQDLLNFVRKISGETDVHPNEKVIASEKATGFRNAALANFLKAYNNIHNDVDEMLDFYYFQCSLEMTCRQLAHAFQIFANHGKIPGQDEQILTKSQIKRMNALMQTCGFYDESGDFTFKVGLPGKSGVGGGIAAVFPQEYSVAVWSPRLNKKGNSVLGLKALELLTTKTGLSIF
ncbi:MAG: glutaminase [Candidatus Cyclobacteriaceae bacterium M2_1C_046]